MQAWLWWKTRRKYSAPTPPSPPEKRAKKNFLLLFLSVGKWGKIYVGLEELHEKREKMVFRENKEPREKERESSESNINPHQVKKRFQSSNCNIVRRNRSCMKITFCRLNNCTVWCATNERTDHETLLWCLRLFRMCNFELGGFCCWNITWTSKRERIAREKKS